MGPRPNEGSTVYEASSSAQVLFNGDVYSSDSNNILLKASISRTTRSRACVSQKINDLEQFQEDLEALEHACVD